MLYTLGIKIITPIISMLAFLHYRYRKYMYMLFSSKSNRKELWILDLPRSHMQYPKEPIDKIKYWFWKVYTPFHPYVRDISYRLIIGKLLARGMVPEMSDTGRQDFLIGILDHKHTARELTTFLIKKGFGNHFIAWKDTDEIVSLRQAIDFKHQYHVRIFRDGEIRCHYEYTPEYRPIQHLRRIGFENRSLEFKKLLKDWIV